MEVTGNYILVKDKMKKIILKKKDGNNIEAQFKVLDITYMDKIMDLQQKIYNGLEDKDFYSCSKREEFENAINGNGKILGCISLKNNELIAMGVYIQYGYEDHNYGYDIELKGKQLEKVGQIESTVVLQDYRGNKLQKIICEILEQIGKDSGMKYICATAAPGNKFSVNTFEKLGYSIMADKLKYGGLRRYVFMKEIS